MSAHTPIRTVIQRYPIGFLKFDATLVPERWGTWKLDAALYFSPDGWVRYIAPRNFETDLASVPRAFWRVMPRREQTARAGAIHDMLYWVGVNRFWADCVFYRALRCDGVDPVRAALMFAAVRLGGWKAYHNHRKAGHNAANLPA